MNNFINIKDKKIKRKHLQAAQSRKMLKIFSLYAEREC